MENQLLAQGVELMLVGMGTVFLFLTLLVIATTLMSRLVMHFQPAADEDCDSDEIAAIAAAIAAYREGPRT